MSAAPKYTSDFVMGGVFLSYLKNKKFQLLKKFLNVCFFKNIIEEDLMQVEEILILKQRVKEQY